MMEKEKIVFAKIFDLPLYQVLVTKEDEDAEFNVIQSTQMELGYSPSMAIKFNNEKARDNYFNEYNEEIAKNFLKDMENFR